MGDNIDLSFAPLAEISARIRARALSPATLAEHVLARVRALNPTLNAFITITDELAREQARRAEREITSGSWRGPLHGIPVAVKDFYDTAGIRTTAGFEHFANRVPEHDADIVRQLREAGAVLIGKTNMHTLGMGTTALDSHFGAVANPRHPDYVAGGSSGGSAAALAAGLCYATIDTDAVGSGRLPATICGVVCLKPSFGVLSTRGILAGEPADPAILQLAHACISARSAADASLVFNALANADASSERVRRIGVVKNCAADDLTCNAFRAAVERLESMDVELIDTRAPFDAASFDVKNIERDRAWIARALFGDVDAIVLPTLAQCAPTLAEARARGPMAVSPENTFFCNYFGVPAISLPAQIDPQRPPVGLQIVGAAGSDARMLAFAREYESKHPFALMPRAYRVA